MTNSETDSDLSKYSMRDALHAFKTSNQFGRLLSFYASTRLMTRKEMAEKMAVSPATISHWITGRRYPDASAIYWIVKVLDLDEQEVSCLLTACDGDTAARQVACYIELAQQQNDWNILLKVYAPLMQKIDDSLKAIKVIKKYSHKKVPRSLIGVFSDVLSEQGLYIEQVENSEDGKSGSIVAKFPEFALERNKKRILRDVESKIKKLVGVPIRFEVAEEEVNTFVTLR